MRMAKLAVSVVLVSMVGMAGARASGEGQGQASKEPAEVKLRTHD